MTYQLAALKADIEKQMKEGMQSSLELIGKVIKDGDAAQAAQLEAIKKEAAAKEAALKKELEEKLAAQKKQADAAIGNIGSTVGSIGSSVGSWFGGISGAIDELKESVSNQNKAVLDYSSIIRNPAPTPTPSPPKVDTTPVDNRTNQQKYLDDIRTSGSSSSGQKAWAEQARYLEDLKSNPNTSSGNKAWADAELKKLYG